MDAILFSIKKLYLKAKHMSVSNLTESDKNWISTDWYMLQYKKSTFSPILSRIIFDVESAVWKDSMIEITWNVKQAFVNSISVPIKLFLSHLLILKIVVNRMMKSICQHLKRFVVVVCVLFCLLFFLFCFALFFVFVLFLYNSSSYIAMYSVLGEILWQVLSKRAIAVLDKGRQKIQKSKETSCQWCTYSLHLVKS